MTLAIEKKNVDIDRLKVWLTSNYDFFGATQDDSRHFLSYQFNVPFGKIYYIQRNHNQDFELQIVSY